jgi:glycosyl transferase family 25
LKFPEERILDIYIINLDKDIQRLEWMDQQLAAQKLKYFRIAAVNGAQILTPRDSYWSDARRSHFGAAEAGCLLSHVQAWRLIADADDEHGLVLEDDIHLSDDFGKFIQTMPLNPRELCVHKLETFCAYVTLTRRPTYTFQKRNAYKLESNHGGAGAYVLNKRTASHLLSHVELFDAAADIELFHPNRRKTKELTIHQWVPAPCIQDFLLDKSKYKKRFPSNIAGDRSDERVYSLKPSEHREPFFKSWLRMLFTKLYSASLWQSGRMRREINFG